MAKTGKAFDMNKPPVSVSNPGQTWTGVQRFPRHLHRADGSHLRVDTEAKQVMALADGWFLTREDARLAAAVAAAEPVKRGPGRPRIEATA